MKMQKHSRTGTGTGSSVNWSNNSSYPSNSYGYLYSNTYSTHTSTPFGNPNVNYTSTYTYRTEPMWPTHTVSHLDLLPDHESRVTAHGLECSGTLVPLMDLHYAFDRRRYPESLQERLQEVIEEYSYCGTCRRIL